MDPDVLSEAGSELHNRPYSQERPMREILTEVAIGAGIVFFTVLVILILIAMKWHKWGKWL
jgi:hypothetical protein